MRYLLAIFIAASMRAQEPAKPGEPAPSAPAAPAAPTGEGWLEGSFEVGYRWIPNISGNLDAYRSVVNLGESPKLLDADFTLRDPKKRVFDRADVHATSWGGDPYNTLRVDIQKDSWYRLTADYRNIAYFNFLPSYADPTISQGLLLDQNSFDTSIRTTSVQLDLLPKKWITPYLASGETRISAEASPCFTPIATNIQSLVCIRTRPITSAAACAWKSAATT
jgi:hypothetical protein